jgi:hypothetical protein
MGKLFGGGDAARKAQEKALAEQRVANDRQLAELRAQEQRTGATRRNPRGRRLFADDAKSSLA